MDPNSHGEEVEETDDRPFSGVRLDDGTGKNVYYLSFRTGKRTRAVPATYVEELLENGDKRYVNRGRCQRCKLLNFPSVFLTRESQSVGFCVNYCEDCLLQSVKPSIKTLRNNGELVYAANVKEPKLCYINLQRFCCDDEGRERDVMDRALYAKYYVLLQAKKKRDFWRLPKIKQLACESGVSDGTYVSWGLDKDKYDEFFGLVDEKCRPHGKGVKYFSDGSVYYGEFYHGEEQTDKADALMTRPDNSSYQGQFVGGMRHGRGVWTYPDQSSYEGEFAKGAEHGYGLKRYPDGSSHNGRFRFGRRDGPGVFTSAQGVVEKGSFRDYVSPYTEKPPPPMVEELETPNQLLSSPPSLHVIAMQAVVQAMVKRRFVVPSPRVTRRLAEHLKPMVARALFETYAEMAQGNAYYKTNEAYSSTAPLFAFKYSPTASFKSMRLKDFDVDTLTYFIGGNSDLEELNLVSNKLSTTSIDLLSKQLQSRLWAKLRLVDFSYNSMDLKAVQALLSGCLQVTRLEHLGVAGCNIKANGAFLFANFLQSNKSLKTLDMAFNQIEALGADSLSTALYTNTTLTSLNIRQNNVQAAGGEKFAEVLKTNKTLRILVLADNKVGPHIIALIAGRLSGSITDMAISSRSRELDMPTWYERGRFEGWNPEKNKNRAKKEYDKDGRVLSSVRSNADGSEEEEEEEEKEVLEPMDESEELKEDRK